jgi:hypothetical protein
MKTLKQEEVDGRAYRDAGDAAARSAASLKTSNNRQRLHSALAYLSPAEFETTLRPARAAVPRGAPPHEDHPACLRRTARPEADVRGPHPRRRPMARTHVRRYLERHAPAPLTLRQVDPLIRELTHYRDVIARKTQEVTP